MDKRSVTNGIVVMLSIFLLLPIVAYNLIDYSFARGNPHDPSIGGGVAIFFGILLSAFLPILIVVSVIAGIIVSIKSGKGQSTSSELKIKQSDNVSQVE